MKCNLSVIVYFLSTSLAFATATSGNMSYASDIMQSFPILRSSLCFEKFIPHINHLADQARESSQVCVNIAVSKRYALQQRGLAEMMTAVRRIYDSLINCTSIFDHIGHFHCLQSIVDEDKQILDMIAKRSADLLKEYAAGMKAISVEENNCLDQVINDAKLKSDRAFEDLKECIRTGYWPHDISSTQSTTTNDGALTTDDSDRERPNQRTEPSHKSTTAAIAVPVGLAVVTCLVVIVISLYKNNYFTKRKSKTSPMPP